MAKYTSLALVFMCGLFFMSLPSVDASPKLRLAAEVRPEVGFSALPEGLTQWRFEALLPKEFFIDRKWENEFSLIAIELVLTRDYAIQALRLFSPTRQLSYRVETEEGRTHLKAVSSSELPRVSSLSWISREVAFEVLTQAEFEDEKKSRNLQILKLLNLLPEFVSNQNQASLDQQKNELLEAIDQDLEEASRIPTAEKKDLNSGAQVAAMPGIEFEPQEFEVPVFQIPDQNF